MHPAALQLIALLVAPLAAAAGPEPPLDGTAMIRRGAVRAEQPLTSVRALRDHAVVKQAYDYSCGSAALATLLTYGVGDAADEAAILKTVFEGITEEQRRVLFEKGLSLLDLRRVAEQRGHKAQGFRIAADQLGKISRPVIVFVKPRGYEHFAVFKGLRGDRVHLADPSLGNLRLPLYRFLEMWADGDGRGIVFAIEPRGGAWPDASPLVPPADAAVPLEVLSTRQLMEVGKAYPLALPAAPTLPRFP